MACAIVELEAKSTSKIVSLDEGVGVLGGVEVTDVVGIGEAVDEVNNAVVSVAEPDEAESVAPDAGDLTERDG